MTWKKVSFLILTSGFWICACSPKSAKKLAEVETIPMEEGENTEEAATTDTLVVIDEPPQEEVIEEPIRIELLASIKKTACYGKCPVFEAKVYSNGRVLFEGKEHVDKVGLFEAKVDEEWIADVKTYAISLGFFSMKEFFPDKTDNIPDLPNTITYFRHKEDENTVTNNHNAPVQLTKIENFLLQKLEALEWTAIIGEN